MVHAFNLGRMTTWKSNDLDFSRQEPVWYALSISEELRKSNDLDFSSNGFYFYDIHDLTLFLSSLRIRHCVRVFFIDFDFNRLHLWLGQRCPGFGSNRNFSHDKKELGTGLVGQNRGSVLLISLCSFLYQKNFHYLGGGEEAWADTKAYPSVWRCAESKFLNDDWTGIHISIL